MWLLGISGAKMGVFLTAIASVPSAAGPSICPSGEESQCLTVLSCAVSGLSPQVMLRLHPLHQLAGLKLTPHGGSIGGRGAPGQPHFLSEASKGGTIMHVFQMSW